MEILSAFIEELRGRRLTEMDKLENLSNRAEAAEATCQSLREQSSRWEAQALEAGVRIAELEALFALQQTRMAEATRMWQEATGKQDVLPDLGDLLAWLMARPAALEALARELRNSLQEMCDAEDAKEYFRMAGALEWAHITIARADKALAEAEPQEVNRGREGRD